MNINIQTNKFDSDFACVLEIIQQHRTQAARAINHASILTAWHVGAYVSEKNQIQFESTQMSDTLIVSPMAAQLYQNKK